MFFRECLPLKIISTRQSGLAGSLPTTVLVHDDPSKALHPWRNPNRKVRSITKFASLCGRFDSDSVIRQTRLREHVVGGRLTKDR